MKKMSGLNIQLCLTPPFTCVLVSHWNCNKVFVFTATGEQLEWVWGEMGSQPRWWSVLWTKGESYAAVMLQVWIGRKVTADHLCSCLCRSTFRSRMPLAGTISVPQSSLISSSRSVLISPLSGNFYPINQLINKSINQSISQWISQSVWHRA